MLVESVESMQASRRLGMIADEGGVQGGLPLRAEAHEALQSSLRRIAPDTTHASQCCSISHVRAATTYDGSAKGSATRGCRRPIR